MHTHLPTYSSGTWTVTSLKDSLISELSTDRDSLVLRMYFYAVTSRGWLELRSSVKKWADADKNRSVVVFVGTDHAITEPAVLLEMQKDGIHVRIMEYYNGVFHPKVVWLEGKDNNTVWVCSNNLTRDGLLNNIEFAVVVKSVKIPDELQKWSDAIESGSTVLTNELFRSYEVERQKFEAKRAKSNATTFTWRRKRGPKNFRQSKAPLGDLIVEVMPKETGSDGTQLQLPIVAAASFFGVKGVGDSKTIDFLSSVSRVARSLTITVFDNRTVRISVTELEYRDRPCLVVFHKDCGHITYEIVAQCIFPDRYKSLLKHCINRTRKGSRRWGIVSEIKRKPEK